MTGVKHMIRNRSTYIACWSASKPGAMSATVCGANANSSRHRTAITTTARVRIVWPKARACSAASARRVTKTGTNGATRPAATKTSSASSGRTNAAL